MFRYYDIRLTMLEKSSGLRPKPFKKKDYVSLNWKRFVYYLYVRTYWIEQVLFPGTIFHRLAVYLPSKIDIEEFNRWNFKPSRDLQRILDRWKKKLKNQKKFFFELKIL